MARSLASPAPRRCDRGRCGGAVFPCAVRPLVPDGPRWAKASSSAAGGWTSKAGRPTRSRSRSTGCSARATAPGLPLPHPERRSFSSCRSPGIRRRRPGRWRRATTGPTTKRSARRVRRECLFCHNAYPAEARIERPLRRDPFLSGTRLPEGIGCQRCHGPGAAHVELVTGGEARPSDDRQKHRQPGPAGCRSAGARSATNAMLQPFGQPDRLAPLRPRGLRLSARRGSWPTTWWRSTPSRPARSAATASRSTTIPTASSKALASARAPARSPASTCSRPAPQGRRWKGGRRVTARPACSCHQTKESCKRGPEWAADARALAEDCAGCHSGAAAHPGRGPRGDDRS